MAPAILSVALCTYNGAAYLGEQLDSIATQSRLPDEVVVCDDGSTDGTVGILQAFVPEAPSLPALPQRPESRLCQERGAGRLPLHRGPDRFTHQDVAWRPERLARALALLGGPSARGAGELGWGHAEGGRT